MKILLVHQLYADDRQPGGTRHYEFARRLVAGGHEVTVVTSNHCFVTGRRLPAQDAPDSYHGVIVRRASTFSATRRGLAGKVLSYVSFMVSALWTGLRAAPPDVVIGTSPPLFQLLPAWLLACLRRRPFVLEVRDLWPAFAIDMGVLRNRAVIRLAELTERFFYRRAARIIVNSPAYIDYLIGLGICAEKLRLIPNGADPDSLIPHDDGPATRESLNLNGQFIVTYAGALGLANDVDTMLDAAECLKGDPGIQILLLGDGLRKSDVETGIAQRGLTNVTLADSVCKDRIADVLATSDACLATLRDIPMFRMTYPNKVFDYMAAGRPTILAIDGVMRQVMEQAHGGICVPPGDAVAIADAIRYLRDHRDEARRMGAAARQYVKQHFHRDDHARLLEKTLLEVAA